MANIICHHNGKYNLYGTISDGFMFESALTLEQLKQVIKQDHGEEGLKNLRERLERAHKNGHSSLVDNEGLDGFLCCNRAGENEKFLSAEECIARFLS